MIEIERVGILLVLWFVTGRQFGHVFAKYARAKKASKIVFLVLLTISIIATIIILN